MISYVTFSNSLDGLKEDNTDKGDLSEEVDTIIRDIDDLIQETVSSSDDELSPVTSQPLERKSIRTDHL